jgi:NADH dehydrogenase FAD-containing subunit
VESIADREIKTVNKEGVKRTIPYDTLIISRERKPNNELYEKLQGRVAEVYKIGDCAAIAEIREAITSANEVARKI